jgi:hypothetical protein
MHLFRQRRQRNRPNEDFCSIAKISVFSSSSGFWWQSPRFPTPVIGKNTISWREAGERRVGEVDGFERRELKRFSTGPEGWSGWRRWLTYLLDRAVCSLCCEEACCEDWRVHLVCEAGSILGHYWPHESAARSAGCSGVDEWAGVGTVSFSHGDLPEGEAGEIRKGQLFSLDFTVKLHAGVEF